ncbi:SRPBCC family protein [Frigidibacter sp. ROC022]|uniref:SRPBCC family protein n=1 Tax=Frigidibacter sp. ROC022 TaxID=2971796 RepID=UPI00215AABE0|nr:SRPBCC family protein [Frigidibacter sp. ROC022]MCR8725959.1 SRPBCC family protein [Frigidibacter sp. ROC022]
MKFSKREDIEAPLDVVFRAVSDFNAFERSAMRRGIEVSRRDDLEQPGVGMAWDVRAPVRGRLRDISIRVAAWAPETSLALNADSSGILATLTVELVALSRNRTRMQVGLELRAVTMSSKLLLQSMKLAKHSLDARFAKRVADFGTEIEGRQTKVGWET